MRTIDRAWCEEHRAFYLLLGDVDKPFHQPECECDLCEQWRQSVGRMTHSELRAIELRAEQGERERQEGQC